MLWKKVCTNVMGYIQIWHFSNISYKGKVRNVFQNWFCEIFSGGWDIYTRSWIFLKTLGYQVMKSKKVYRKVPVTHNFALFSMDYNSRSYTLNGLLQHLAIQRNIFEWIIWCSVFFQEFYQNFFSLPHKLLSNSANSAIKIVLPSPSMISPLATGPNRLRLQALITFSTSTI